MQQHFKKSILVPILVFAIGAYAVMLDYKMKKQSKEFHSQLENYRNQIREEIQRSFNTSYSKASGLNNKLDEVNQMLDSNQKLNTDTIPKLNSIEPGSPELH